MKLGFVSAILPNNGFEYVIDLASSSGFDSVEVMCWPKGKAQRRYAGVTHVDVDNLSDDRSKEIRDILLEKKVEISALGYYPNPLDQDPQKRAIYTNHIKKIILAAPKLGVDTVTTFIGRDQASSLKDNMKMFEQVWPELIKLAESVGVKVAIENCPMFFTMDEWPGGQNLATTPKIWTEMFSVIDSDYFGLNYDPSHFIWQQMDYIKPIREFASKLFQIHIKDAKLYPDLLDRVGIMATPLEYHSPKLPGLGDIDWGRFISALRDVQYKGHMVIEVEDKDYEDSQEDRIKAIQVSKRYIDQFIRS